MEILKADHLGKSSWNRFVMRHYPPVGAFMQSWEWGEFQKALGRNVERYIAAQKPGGEPIAAFALVHHPLPLGQRYAYIPRGPVLANHAVGEAESLVILRGIKDWAQTRLQDPLFLRLEPPLDSITNEEAASVFKRPAYYVQPRRNHIVPLHTSEETIAARFHSSTRSNIRRAERRGVTVLTKLPAEADLDCFFAMARDTIGRNGGKNAYPSREYFRTLIKTLTPLTDTPDPSTLSLAIFDGRENGEPAAMHFVLFFGGTATYLFGASHDRSLRSKVTTYLHWSAMREAAKRGFKYYDLGGVDEALWPTLTQFKRQFRGEEIQYIGNLDIPLRPILYKTYNLLRKLRKFK